MVPDIAAKGHSFKGAFAYYLHDKRQDAASPHLETAERVAWTETRNLATDDPRIAKRVMIATALSADELKKAAGVRNSGRKSAAHVYAYSLAWHPDEAGKLDQVEMTRAADASLKALGADHLQALIVCHSDRRHPHIHVIINRVDPATGKMHGFSNDRLQLSDWANAYERERGQILTPAREEKRQLREQFAAKAERRDYAEKKRAESTARPSADKSPAAMLKEFGDAQKIDHRKQWADLAARQKVARDRIYSAAGSAIKEAAARHKAETRPMWGQYFREQRAAEWAFQQREATIGGRIKNAMDATTQQRISGQLGSRGALSATFGNVFSSQARAAAFAARQDMTRQQLQQRLRAILDAEVGGIKQRRASALVAQRQAFDVARASLIERQDIERGKIREAWKLIYADREAADRARDRAQQHRQRMTTRNQIRRPDNAARERWQDRREGGADMKARQNAAPMQEQKPMKRPFENARSGPEDAPRAPTRTAFVSQPGPAPSPSGDVPRPAQKVAQEVPVKTPALPAASPAPLPRKDWNAAAAKPTPAPRKDWNATASERAREIKPLPPRSPDRDREPDR